MQKRLRDLSNSEATTYSLAMVGPQLHGWANVSEAYVWSSLRERNRATGQRSNIRPKPPM